MSILQRLHMWRHGRWLIWLITMNLMFACEKGATTNQVDSVNKTAQPWLEEVAEQNGLVFEHQSGHFQEYFMPEIACGGGALFDMDGDGDLDAYLIQSGSLVAEPNDRPGNQLFRNRGDGTFEDVTAGSGADDHGYGMGVATGDYDNDGDIDLYVTNLGPDVLLRNDGNGKFSDVTSDAGIDNPQWGASAAFVDYDNDGDLDLFVANYVAWSFHTERICTDTAGEADYCTPESYAAPTPDVLFRNEGDGTFTDVSIQAGLRTAFGNGLGVVCGDFNNDGLIDIFVANDKTLNQLWQNQGDGTFRDVAGRTGCALDEHGQAKAGMGTTAVDIDDDGDLDLMVVNLQAESDSLYRNNNGSYFTDETASAGLGTLTRPFTRFGMGLSDFDNDGRLDFYVASGRVFRLSYLLYAKEDAYAEPNLLARGLADGRFEEVLPRGGTSELLAATSRAAIFGDVDNDGGIDILVVNRDGPAHLLLNVVKSRGHWLMFRVLDEHGRDALGAKLTLRAGERLVTRDVRTAYSYLAANDPRIHVGLGRTTTVEDVTIRWPDGSAESFGAFDAGHVVTLHYGTGNAVANDPSNEREQN